MDRVSTATLYSSLVGNLMTAQSNQVSAANQVASGKVATDLQGFGSQAQTLTAMQTVQAQTQSFLDQGNAISAKLTSQDTAFTQISNSMNDASSAISSALATGSGSNIMQSLETAFQGVVAGLNTTFNGQYIFSGGQVNSPATSATSLASLTSAPSVGSLFNNDQYVASNQISQNSTIQTGFLASNVGTAAYNAFQSIESYVQTNGPFTSPLTTAQTSFLQSTLSTFQSAAQGVTTVQAQNGLLQTEVTNTQTDLTDQSTTMQSLIGNITDADMAKASTNLQQAQLALQASAKVIASLQSDSLVTLLPVH
ncbi:flagellin [Phenylobacterium montanum]|uniref:Flagellin n=1 Tax=Phenylobacterium montanum TaxID=2823693 RepID=A0A975IWN6_9CAUL|nr:flagellin [Caulobacter sp. S6]QUD90030.1 flagellin [Caulobacter sp. S6]